MICKKSKPQLAKKAIGRYTQSVEYMFEGMWLAYLGRYIHIHMYLISPLECHPFLGCSFAGNCSRVRL